MRGQRRVGVGGSPGAGGFLLPCFPLPLLFTLGVFSWQFKQIHVQQSQWEALKARRKGKGCAPDRRPRRRGVQRDTQPGRWVQVRGGTKILSLAADSCCRTKRAVSPSLLGKHPRATGSQGAHMQTPYLMNLGDTCNPEPQSVRKVCQV